MRNLDYSDSSSPIVLLQATPDRERWFHDLLQALPAAVYTTDRHGKITFYNEAAVSFSGRRPVLGSDEWCVSWRLYHADGVTPMPHDECPMAVALKEGRAIGGTEAIAERPDGSRVPFIPYPALLRDESGEVIGAVNMLVDITERKEAEQRQKLMHDELNHRVKNTLATVQLLAAQTLRGVSPEAKESFEARIFALSNVHSHLSAANWESADLRLILEDLVAVHQKNGGSRVRLEGESVLLRPRTAQALSMVLHELATNAIKFGALSVPEGSVRISWNAVGPIDYGELRLDWEESGGPRVSPPEKRGFGSRLLERAITQELRGTLQMTFEPTGMRCIIGVPLRADPK